MGYLTFKNRRVKQVVVEPKIEVAEVKVEEPKKSPRKKKGDE